LASAGKGARDLAHPDRGAPPAMTRGPVPGHGSRLTARAQDRLGSTFPDAASTGENRHFRPHRPSPALHGTQLAALVCRDHGCRSIAQKAPPPGSATAADARPAARPQSCETRQMLAPQLYWTVIVSVPE
jgi:hypothetical protein